MGINRVFWLEVLSMCCGVRKLTLTGTGLCPTLYSSFSLEVGMKRKKLRTALLAWVRADIPLALVDEVVLRRWEQRAFEEKGPAWENLPLVAIRQDILEMRRDILECRLRTLRAKKASTFRFLNPVLAQLKDRE